MIWQTRKVMPKCSAARRSLWLSLIIVALPLFSLQSAPELPKSTGQATFQYGIEWRLVRAGLARLIWTASSSSAQGDLHLESAGLVTKLYKVNDDYRVSMTPDLCATSIVINAEEGKRQRSTKVTFDRAARKASYLERDLVKNALVLAKEIETPPCVYDYVGGLNKLRGMNVEPGQSVQLPLSDGKKFANVRVEAQEREEVKTPLGTFKTVRYEILMFNDVLVNKKARLFVWITDDARRLPVQIRVRMQFLIGTITLQLEKEEHG
jgi:hypothetical protein